LKGWGVFYYLSLNVREKGKNSHILRHLKIESYNKGYEDDDRKARGEREKIPGGLMQM